MRGWWWETLHIAWRRGALIALLDAVVADPTVAAMKARFEALREPVAQLQAQPAPAGVSVTPPDNVVLFHEGKGLYSWTGSRPTITGGYSEAAKMVAAIPGTSYDRNRGSLSGSVLAGRRVLILPIGPRGETHLSSDELTALDNFIGDGGGLLALSTYGGDGHHDATLNGLLKSYGILCNADTVMPRKLPDREIGTATHTDDGPASEYVLEALPDEAAIKDPGRGIREKLLAGVTSVLALGPCSLSVQPSLAASVLRSRSDSWVCVPDQFQVETYITEYPTKVQRPADIVAASTQGKVVVGGSWRIFEDKFMSGGNRQLFQNILSWLVAGD
jgi:hypothetical protein